MITLYHSPKSRSSRMIWLLEELGQPYEIKQVSIFRPMTGEGAPDPANPHPDKRVPAIVHNGELVAESVAMVLYLTDAFPEARLGPLAGAPGRGEYLTWLAWYASELEPALFASMDGTLTTSPIKQRDHAQMVARLEAALSHGPWLMGEYFTGADLLVGSAINFGRAAFPATGPVDDFAQRCKARPAAVRGGELDEASGVQKAA